MLAARRLFEMEVNTTYLHVPDGDNSVVLTLDGPTSKLSFYSTSENITPLHPAHTKTCIHPHILYTHCVSVAVEGEIFTTLHHRQAAMGGGSPKCMKKHEAAAVSMEQKKQ